MKQLLIVFIVYLLPFVSNGQGGYVSRMYTANDGMPASQAFNIFQDSRDFIWIGTAAGLSRFDGRQFHNYGAMDGLEGALVNTIKEDKKGALWISTSAGLFKYDGNKFHRIRSGLAEITDIFPLRDSVWVATKKGLLIFGLNGELLKTIYEDDGLLSNKVTTLCGLRDGGLLIGTNKGINKFDRRLSDFWKPSETDYVMSIAEDRAGGIWVGTLNSQIYHYSGNVMNNVTQDTESISMPRSIIVNKAGEVLVAYEFGFSVFVNGGFVGLRSYIDQGENGIYAAMQDREGNYWLTTSRGLILLKPSGGKKYAGAPQGLFSVYRAEGDTNVYVSGCQHIYVVRKDTLIEMFAGRQRQLGCSEVIAKNADGAFLVGTRIGDLRLYGQGNPRLVSREPVWCSLQQAGNIWFGGNNGILKFDKDSLIAYKAREDGLRVLSMGPTRRADVFLLGTSESLYLFSNGKYIPMPLAGLSIKFSTLDICRISDDSYLLATRGYGVMRVRLKPDHCEVIDVLNARNGLNTDFINKVCIAPDGKWWLLTMNGVYSVDDYFGKRHIQYLNGEDGLLKNTWESGAILPNKDGSVFVAGSQGLALVYGNAPAEETVIQKTHLMGLEVNNKPFKWQLPDTSLSFTGFPGEYEFGPRERSITFHYTGISYSQPGRVKYQYMLEGYDDHPMVGSSQFINYNDLPPGDYLFKVRSTDKQVFTSEPFAQFPFVIRPPFWQTLWFRALVIMLFGGSIYWFYTWRLHEQYKKQALELEMTRQLSETKVLAFQARMNPHFIFNSLNAIQYFMLNNDKISTLNYLSKFAKLLRQILDNSVESKINLEMEIAMLRSYIEIEELRFEKRFTYAITVEEGLNPSLIEIPGMIIQPFVENAIVHGLLHKQEPGKLTISFATTGAQLICTVEDNGIGRRDSLALNARKSTKRQSHGTAIAISRLELFNDPASGLFNKVCFIDLEDDNTSSTGTKVLIHIPIL